MKESGKAIPILMIMKVSFDELETAFLSSGEEISYWLDKKTGKVIFIGSESVFGDIYREEEERQTAHEILIICGEVENDENIEIDEGRYLLITPPHSGEKFKVMEDFTLNFANHQIQPKLITALRGSKPFRKFKDVLLNYPDERKKWFDFETENLRKFIEDWANSENIELDYNQ